MPASPPVDWAMQEDLQSFMVRVEGERTKPYADTKGLTSIGIGRNLDGVGLRADEVTYLFRNDVRACCGIMDQHIAWWRELDRDAQIAMVSLCFMGWGTFSQFVHFLGDMQFIAEARGTGDLSHIADYVAAAHADLKNSAWWAQVGQRGPLTLALIHV